MTKIVPYALTAVLAAAATAGVQDVLHRHESPKPQPAPARVEPRAVPGPLAQGPAVPPVEPAEPPRKASPAPASRPSAGLDTPVLMTPEERINVAVYDGTNRGVVNITSRVVHPDDFFGGGGVQEGSGSGSVLDRQGHILTNYHVVEDARKLTVTLFDGKSYPATLSGADPNTDTAILQIDAPPDRLFPIPLGESTSLLVGQRVLAIGNPFGLERTLTTGIISSLNRSLSSDNGRRMKGIIQTDAAINPGNSGGPLLNSQGQMIGMNTAILSRVGQSSGVGFAIPINNIRRILRPLLKYGKVIRADLGVARVLETDSGLRIVQLAPHGAAAEAGLRGPQVTVRQQGIFEYRVPDMARADLIVAIDGRPVTTVDDLLTEVEAHRPGDTVDVTVIRQGRRVTVPVRLDASD